MRIGDILIVPHGDAHFVGNGRNSREAADAVRKFTDNELDRAAPFSLSFGAPVTAQFVIEDKAVRHSWHHLARIRTALGR